MNSIQKLLFHSANIEALIQMGLDSLYNSDDTAVFDSAFNIVIYIRDEGIFPELSGPALSGSLWNYAESLCDLSDAGDVVGFQNKYKELVATVRLAFDAALTQNSTIKA